MLLALLAASFTACQSPASVVQVESKYLPVDSTLDATPHAEALALLAPYKHRVDSLMQSPVGRTDMELVSHRPESPLSNLVADVLRRAAIPYIGHEADMGLVNVGGIRSSLPLGNLTTANIFEILPFENSLCIITLKGTALKQLLAEIAATGGEGVSGIRMRIGPKGELKEATVGGKPIADDRTYTVATIDYLADGNDRMTACLQAESRQCPEGKTLRSLFMDYVKAETAAGRAVTSRIEGRVVVE